MSQIKGEYIDMSNILTKFEREFGLTINDEGKVVTNSIKVAEYYKKEHKNVMARIREYIDLIPELGRLNFKQSSYLNEQNKKQPMYILDRQGFSMLVNKFTGDEATLFTYRYTQAFEQMNEEIIQRREQMTELTNKATTNNGLTLDQFNDSRFGTPQRRRLALMDATIDGRDSVFAVYADMKDYMIKWTAQDKITALLHAERVLSDKQDTYGKDVAFVHKIEELLRSVSKDIDKQRNWQNGAAKRGLAKENKKLQKKIDEIIIDINDMYVVDYHGFSENSMYDRAAFGKKKTSLSAEYKNWKKRFPYHQLPNLEELEIDVTKPMEFICYFDHMSKVDVINLDKSLADLIARHFLFDDNLIVSSTQKTNDYVDSFKKGKIYFLLRNV